MATCTVLCFSRGVPPRPNKTQLQHAWLIPIRVSIESNIKKTGRSNTFHSRLLAGACAFLQEGKAKAGHAQKKKTHTRYIHDVATFDQLRSVVGRGRAEAHHVFSSERDTSTQLVTSRNIPRAPAITKNVQDCKTGNAGFDHRFGSCFWATRQLFFFFPRRFLELYRVCMLGPKQKFLFRPSVQRPQFRPENV